MNKGIIYEECSRYDNALDCYLNAVNTFISLYKDDPDERGIIINALFTAGTFYYKRGQFKKAYETLESALNYFGDGKELDRRYWAIKNLYLASLLNSSMLRMLEASNFYKLLYTLPIS